MMMFKYPMPARLAAMLCVATLVGPLCAKAAPEGGLLPDEALYSLGVQAFREGRFPEAYGRFVALAEAGHAKASRHALWMCEHGPSLFGRQWDCGPEQVERWIGSARGATQALTFNVPARERAAPPPA